MKNLDSQHLTSDLFRLSPEQLESPSSCPAHLLSVDESVIANSQFIIELARTTDRYTSAVVGSLDALICSPCSRAGRVSFCSTDGTLRISLKFRPHLRYGDGAAIGVAMIRGYICATRLAELRGIGRLLRRRGAKAITAPMLVELELMARRSTDSGFIEGVERLKKAVTVERKFTYIEMRKHESGAWHTIYSKKLNNSI